jgi:hypothetical protein
MQITSLQHNFASKMISGDAEVSIFLCNFTLIIVQWINENPFGILLKNSAHFLKEFNFSHFGKKFK